MNPSSPLALITPNVVLSSSRYSFLRWREYRRRGNRTHADRHLPVPARAPVTAAGKPAVYALLGRSRRWPNMVADMTDESEFPLSLGKVARRELAANGITKYDQLLFLTPADLLAIHGVGPKARDCPINGV